MLNPYKGPREDRPLTREEIEVEVAYYKRMAMLRGEPIDPRWEQWLYENELGEFLT